MKAPNAAAPGTQPALPRSHGGGRYRPRSPDSKVHRPRAKYRGPPGRALTGGRGAGYDSFSDELIQEHSSRGCTKASLGDAPRSLPPSAVPLAVDGHPVGKRAFAQALQVPHHRPSVHQGSERPLQGSSGLRLFRFVVFKKKKKHIRITVRTGMVKSGQSVLITTALPLENFG